MSKPRKRAAAVSLLSVFAWSCGSSSAPANVAPSDAGGFDAQLPVDGGPVDAGPKDAAIDTYFTFDAAAPAGTMSFIYMLPSDLHTSAGVFDSSGALIRTLWSNLAESAGTYTKSWDGNDDAGKSVAATDTFTIKVLSNAVNYTWDGVIGATEVAWTGSANIWDGLGYTLNQVKLAFVGDSAWVAAGYSEGTENLFYFKTSAPNAPVVVNPAYTSFQVEFTDIDTDGSYLYMPNTKVVNGESFVTKFDTTGAPAKFTNGTTISGQQYAWASVSMNGIAVATTNAPDSIAVQNTGSILAVGYSKGNSVSFFDKTSGATKGSTLSINAPTSMGFTSAGLWVLSGSTVTLITDPSGANTKSTPLSGLANPVYVATNKTNNHVFVLDGGTSQQVKEFDTSYAVVRTYGDKGGYNDFDPTITNTRLMFDETATKGTPTTNGSWLKVSPSNELWFCDGGNATRVIHVSAANAYVDRILFGQERYSLGVSLTDPTRIFQNAIEYSIDYSEPLVPGDADPALGGNGAWKMVRNWNVGIGGANGAPFVTDYSIEAALTLSNGRTYAYAQDDKGIQHEVELPATGPMRLTGMQNTTVCSTSSLSPPPCYDYNNYTMQFDGSIVRMMTSGSSFTLSRAELTSFSDAGDPVRGDYTDFVSITYDAATETAPSLDGWGMPIQYQPTTEGVYAMYRVDPSKTTGYPHLSGAIAGRDSYLFHTNREGTITVPDFMGTWPETDSFGGHDGIASQTVGNNIFTMYDGQYATYGNTNYHYWTDGLMVGQFNQMTAAWKSGQPRPATASGNIAQARFVSKDADNAYMYMSTEAGFTPIQRWHLSNLSSIAEVTSMGTLGHTVLLR